MVHSKFHPEVGELNSSAAHQEISLCCSRCNISLLSQYTTEKAAKQSNKNTSRLKRHRPKDTVCNSISLLVGVSTQDGLFAGCMFCKITHTMKSQWASRGAQTMSWGDK